jgi:hypothetical protein
MAYIFLQRNGSKRELPVTVYVRTILLHKLIDSLPLRNPARSIHTLPPLDIPRRTERFFALNFLASHNLERKRRRGSTRRSQSRQSLWYCADEGRCRDGAQGSRHDCCLCLCVRVCVVSVCVRALCTLVCCLLSRLRCAAFFGRAAVEVSKAIF